MFGDRRRRRRLAAQMLLVWLLALVSGIVNACLIEPALRLEVGLAVPAPHAAHALHRLAPAADAPVREHGVPQVASPACVKFCDDEAAGATWTRPLAQALGAAGLAPLLTQSLAVQAALPPRGVLRPRPPPRQGTIPVPIAFLRLTR